MAQIPVYVNDELKRVVEQIAREEERSVSFIIRRWIKLGIQQRKSLASPVLEKANPSRQFP